MADVIHGIGRSFRGAFENLGHEFIAINLLNIDEVVESTNALLHRDVAFVFSFVMMGTDIMVGLKDGGKMPVWDALNVPYISIYGDSPAYFFDRHVFSNPGYVGLYGFPEHLELRRRLPHIHGLLGALKPMAIDIANPDEINFKEKVDGPVIFLKNGNDPKKLKGLWLSSIPQKISSILMDLAAELEARINDKTTTQIDNLVLDYFHDRDLDIAALTKLRLFLIAQLDDYLRRVKSVLVVEALLDLPVLLHGYGWDHIDFAGARLQHVPGGHFNSSRDLIRQSLATIDMSPNTGLAPHDRPLRAIGSHTLCVTNEQEFFARELPHSEDYFYRFDKDSIQSRITDVLTHRQRSVDIGRDVARVFLQKFPPEDFARHMLEVAAYARFNQLPALPHGMPDFLAWPPKKL